MFSIKLFHSWRPRTIVAPNNLIAKIILTKDLIKQDFHIMTNVPIKMNKDASVFTHYTFDSQKVIIHPVKVSFFVPNISIHLLLKFLELINA